MNEQYFPDEEEGRDDLTNFENRDTDEEDATEEVSENGDSSHCTAEKAKIQLVIRSSSSESERTGPRQHQDYTTTQETKHSDESLAPNDERNRSESCEIVRRLSPAERTTRPGAVSVVLREPSVDGISEELSDEDHPILISAELVDEELQDEVERLRQQLEANMMPIPTLRAEILEPIAGNLANSGEDKDSYESASNKCALTRRRTICLGLAVGVVIATVFFAWSRYQGQSSAPANAFVSEQENGTTTVVDLITQDSRLQKLRNYLNLTGLTDILLTGQLGNVTMFAPTDLAFDQADSIFLNFDQDTSRRRFHLRNLLQKHIFVGSLHEDHQPILVDGQNFTMFNNETVEVHQIDGSNQLSLTPSFLGNQSVLTDEPMISDTGDIIYVVDGLLKPNYADVSLYQLAIRLNLTATLEWVETANLGIMAQSLAQTTILAPSNEAAANMDPQTRAALLNDNELLTQVILLHMRTGFLSTDEMRDPIRRGPDGHMGGDGMGTFLRTYPADDGTLSVGLDNGVRAKIVLGDQLGINWFIHVVDNFLIPDY